MVSDRQSVNCGTQTYPGGMKPEEAPSLISVKALVSHLPRLEYLCYTHYHSTFDAIATLSVNIPLRTIAAAPMVHLMTKRVKRIRGGKITSA